MPSSSTFWAACSARQPSGIVTLMPERLAPRESTATISPVVIDGLSS